MAQRRSGTSGQQMRLGGFAAQPASDRLFFAVYPDAQTARHISELASSVRARHGLRGQPLRADRLHVTLHHLGDHAWLPESVVAAAGVAAAKLDTLSLEVSFDCVASFTGHAHKRPCVLRSGKEDANPALFALQRTLGERLGGAGLGRHVEGRVPTQVTPLSSEQAVVLEPVEVIHVAAD